MADPKNVCEQQPGAECFCGMPVTVRRILKQGPDHLKRYASCPKDVGDPRRCAFFSFDVAPDDGEEVKQSSCLCNLKCNTFQIRKEGPNKNRFFDCCGLPLGHPDRCEFYQIQGGPRFEPLPEGPVGECCFCGARVRVGTKTKPGMNQGRCYYTCGNKTCAFFRWI